MTQILKESLSIHTFISTFGVVFVRTR